MTLRKGKQPHFASGSQIGKRTKKMVACISCDVARMELKAGTLCPKCSEKLVTFDSTGEWKTWLTLRHAEKVGSITELKRQLRMPLITSNNAVVGHWIADYSFVEKDKRVFADYKGGAMTELAAWKIKHFQAQYETEVIIFGGR